MILRKNPDQRQEALFRLMTQLQGLPLNREWSVEVKEFRKTRTPEQNAALFGVAYKVIRDETGQDDLEQMHEDFCGDYFGWVDYEWLGQTKRKPRRTTTKDENGKRDVLKTKDFSEFYAFVQRRAAEFGIFVPDPDPYA